MRNRSLTNVQKKQVRKIFGRLRDSIPVPNLIGIQSKSFNDFVQLDYLPNERESVGLEKVLRDIFPIDYEGKMSLEYVSYELGDWACTCGKLTGILNRYSWHCSSCKTVGCSRLNLDFSCPSCSLKTARYKTCSTCLSRVTVQVPMSVDECRVSGQTFALPLKIVIQLINWEQTDGNRVVRDIKEQEIFFSEIPIMTELYEKDGRFKAGSTGTFLINGVDRVIVSQMHRSPGVVFSRSKKAKDLRGKPHYLGRIIPMRGSWLDFEFDSNDLLYVRVDKKKKFPVTTFLQALGIARDSIMGLFYHSYTALGKKGSYTRVIDQKLIGTRIEKGMLPEKWEKELLGRRLNQETITKLTKDGIQVLDLTPVSLLNKVLAKDLIDPETGEIVVEQGNSLSEEAFEHIKRYKTIEFELVDTPSYVLQPTIAMTLINDRCVSQDEALRDLFTKVWPGDSSSVKDMKERLESVFFSSRSYDLTRVGRVRINRKLGLHVDESQTALTMDDIIQAIKYLVNLRERGEGELDDIDHLGNRRVRLVGELLANQVHIGFSRIERIVKERFRIQEVQGALMPQDLLNVKPLSAVLREFFGTGQLSQFMDQTNPLSEIAHKRRLSALGPGGVIKDRATYEIRDVHPSHYGRICPIETPEGQTIGLISSLATYATVNDLGFIESAYLPVNDGKIGEDAVFLDAFQELDKYIAQVDASKDGKQITEPVVLARHEGNFVYADPAKVEYIDLSPKQLVSVAAALIPFLEHDDASRALMGANMQRQAVPLVRCQPPLVGTGMENEVCKASGAALVAKRAGIVEYVCGDRIIVRADEESFPTIDEWVSQAIDVYHLRKYQQSSYSTWIHQRPTVKRGDRVQVGQFLTDGPAVVKDELSLGTNLLVAFMAWQGYNFEDAIVLNKRLVADEVLTSVHIDEYVVEARDTKLGPEEITKDIPNVSETALSSLDEDGIVRIGTRVQPGDILVGKVTLKGDVQYSPEEKLLRAIFGEKSREVKDTSLRVPPGIEGTVVDVKMFSRSGVRKDRRYREEVQKDEARVEADFKAQETYLKAMMVDKITSLLHNQKPKSANVVAKVLANDVYDAAKLKEKDVEFIVGLRTKDEKVNAAIAHLKDLFEKQVSILAGMKEERFKRLRKGDVLPSGVIKTVKIYIASKRHVSVGDKLALRHGNKGVVSTILPREDMPYLDDGTPVDIVLNPLGIPSRMNVGQMLEAALGRAGKGLATQLEQLLQTQGYEEVKKFLGTCFSAEFVTMYEKQHGKEQLMELARQTAASGVHFSSPVFDGARFEHDIQPRLQEIGANSSGAVMLRDGRTGNYFDQPVTVGYVYIMKLIHMVDEKLHARSVGPYSLVTQQPLGGKSQFGGQRFGEMEVWALEAYGAAYALQEMLTYKSDDVNGRHKVYEAIIRGDDVPEPGLPESFSVLIKELQSLGLQVDLIKTSKEEISE